MGCNIIHFGIAQARGGLLNENAISNTASVAGHEASCDLAELPRVSFAKHHHDAEIHPTSLARPVGAFCTGLNPDTGSGHSRPETCRAVPRDVLGLAVAPDQCFITNSPHRSEKENVRAC